MLRKKKKFAFPKKPFDKPRIIEENRLVEKYGLKNKKEIWKTEAKVKYFRNRGKALITAEAEEQEKFFKKLNKIGLNVKNIPDVLALGIEDLLKRRLPSILFEKKIANTHSQARQMVVHKKIMVGGKVVNIPSYIVQTSEQNYITIRKKVKIKKVEEIPKTEEVSEEKPEMEEIVEEGGEK